MYYVKDLIPALSIYFFVFQGYNKRLRELFIEAGYYMSPEKQTAVALQAHLSETAAADKARGEFRSLPKCLEVGILIERGEFRSLPKCLEVGMLINRQESSGPYLNV